MQKNLKENILMTWAAINENMEISPGVHIISFDRDFEFVPGQVIKIAISYEHPPRLYSICSAANDRQVRILFYIKPGGFLSPQLSGLKPGDRILVSKPFGSFVLNNQPACFIATGTGIAPFYSMLCSGTDQCKLLIHGVRQENQFYFRNEITSLLGENYIRCCSGEILPDAFSGRVTDYLQSLKTLPRLKYYICGNPSMVVEVRDFLISQGIGFENILSEIYF